MSRRVSCILAAAFISSISIPSAAFGAVVAQWNMDNTFGTTMTDSSGNGNDGTTYDVTTSGAGYMFNGSSSKVIVPDSPSLRPGTSDFSYSVQVQTDRIPPKGTDYDLLRKGTSIRTGGEYKLEIVYSKGLGKAFCVVQDAAGNKASIKGTTNVADGQLHTLTCIKTSTGLTLQVDSLAPRTANARLTGEINSPKILTVGVKQSLPKSDGDDWYSGTMRSATVSIGD